MGDEDNLLFQVRIERGDCGLHSIMEVEKWSHSSMLWLSSLTLLDLLYSTRAYRSGA